MNILSAHFSPGGSWLRHPLCLAVRVSAYVNRNVMNKLKTNVIHKYKHIKHRLRINFTFHIKKCLTDISNLPSKQTQSLFIFCEINIKIWLMQAAMQSSAIKSIVSKNYYMIICMFIFTSLIQGLRNTGSPVVPGTLLPKLINCLLSFITRNIEVLWHISLLCCTLWNWYVLTLAACNYNVPVIQIEIIRPITCGKKIWLILCMTDITISDLVI